MPDAFLLANELSREFLATNAFKVLTKEWRRLPSRRMKGYSPRAGALLFALVHPTGVDGARLSREGAQMRKVIFIALGLTALVPALAESQEIKGAGSSFAYPIIANWSREWSKQASNGAEKTSAWVDYQSIGSGGGILRIKQRSVDFGASDVPLKSDELKQAGLAQFPIVIGGVVPVVNVAGVEAAQSSSRQSFWRGSISARSIAGAIRRLSRSIPM